MPVSSWIKYQATISSATQASKSSPSTTKRNQEGLTTRVFEVSVTTIPMLWISGRQLITPGGEGTLDADPVGLFDQEGDTPFGTHGAGGRCHPALG
jgi:hypothetical protein